MCRIFWDQPAVSEAAALLMVKGWTAGFWCMQWCAVEAWINEVDQFFPVFLTDRSAVPDWKSLLYFLSTQPRLTQSSGFQKLAGFPKDNHILSNSVL